jgi:hypothetical protein
MCYRLLCLPVPPPSLSHPGPARSIFPLRFSPYLLLFHTLANSFALRIFISPFLSSSSKLSAQNTRGGVPRWQCQRPARRPPSPLCNAQQHPQPQSPHAFTSHFPVYPGVHPSPQSFALLCSDRKRRGGPLSCPERRRGVQKTPEVGVTFAGARHITSNASLGNAVRYGPGSAVKSL